MTPDLFVRCTVIGCLLTVFVWLGWLVTTTPETVVSCECWPEPYLTCECVP